MKIMNVALNIDVANIEHVEALEVFMRTLGGHSTNRVTLGVVMSPAINGHNPDNPQPEVLEEKPKRTRKPATKEVAPVTEEEEETEEEEDTDDSLLGDDEPVIDTAMLRTLTSEKLNVEDATVKAANTKAVKAKLVEYGVNNVTTLPEAKFKEYYEFITAL